ncbi:MAG: formylglycine-generating enzyme family protein [Microscillaceae bacterium]|nr:formylglycine-generating enzyme family protein [Microscillaceae bacterium]
MPKLITYAKIFFTGWLLQGGAQQSLWAQHKVVFEGGMVEIGTTQGAKDEAPPFRTFLASFELDAAPVTVAEFRRFVKINRYVTQAEKLGYGTRLNPRTVQPDTLSGANWAFPLGPQQAPARPEEPVRQISWHDAQAYAFWVGKRLPSEFELEHAMRNLGTQTSFTYLDGRLWHWCDNWYQQYDAQEYYQTLLNQQKFYGGGFFHRRAFFGPPKGGPSPPMTVRMKSDFAAQKTKIKIPKRIYSSRSWA